MDDIKKIAYAHKRKTFAYYSKLSESLFRVL